MCARFKCWRFPAENGVVFYVNNVKFNSNYIRGNYSVIVIWQSKTQAGIGLISFNINTIPAIIIPKTAYLFTNYCQDIDIIVDYKDIEIMKPLIWLYYHFPLILLVER